MQIKYKDHWPSIIESGKEQNLDFDTKLILLALMEIDDDGGNELYKLEARGQDIKRRSQVYAKWLRNKEYHYQNYLKRLSIEEEPFEFLEYIIGDNENIIKYINIIQTEFIFIKGEN